MVRLDTYKVRVRYYKTEDNKYRYKLLIGIPNSATCISWTTIYKRIATVKSKEQLEKSVKYWIEHDRALDIRGYREDLRIALYCNELPIEYIEMIAA